MPKQKIYIQWKDRYGVILPEQTWSFHRINETDIPYITEQDFSSEQAINEDLCQDCKPYNGHDSCECDWCFVGQMKDNL